MIKKYLTRAFKILLLVFLFVTATIQILTLFLFPTEVILVKGNELELKNIPGIFKTELLNEPKTVAANIDIVGSKIKAVSSGSSNLSVKAFGAVNVKTISVEVVDKKKVAASGLLVGLKIKSKGLLVVDKDVVKTEFGDVDVTADADIQKGDYIIKINNKKITKVTDFLREIQSSDGKYITIELQRDNETIITKVKPVKSIEDDKYHVGIWIREGVAGIGTMTFFDPSAGTYGALGHGIVNSENNNLLPITSGVICGSELVDIKKSTDGNPGEVRGVVVENKVLGEVEINSDQGIFGKLLSKTKNYETLEVASRYEVKEGAAKIRCNLENNEIKEYDIKIINVNPDFVMGTKGFVIEVTDKRLLELTGGIVQGMSGSPVIQNGKIVGAVTHVIVNDTKRGYGVFIDSMLSQSHKIK